MGFGRGFPVTFEGFHIRAGIRQRCPINSLLFALVVDIRGLGGEYLASAFGSGLGGEYLACRFAKLRLGYRIPCEIPGKYSNIYTQICGNTWKYMEYIYIYIWKYINISKKYMKHMQGIKFPHWAILQFWLAKAFLDWFLETSLMEMFLWTVGSF